MKTAIQQIIDTLEEGIKIATNEMVMEDDSSTRLSIKAFKKGLEAGLELAKSNLQTEKEQIIAAYNVLGLNGEAYYNQTFNQK